MKKVLVLLMLAISLNSCGGDCGGCCLGDPCSDDLFSDVEIDYVGDLDLDLYYTITIESECGDASTQNKYCVSEETISGTVYLSDDIIAVCTEISFNDFDGNSQSGFYHSVTIGNKESSNCN